MYAAVPVRWNQESLEQVADVVISVGCEFPPASRFNTPGGDPAALSGYGNPTADEVRQWRYGS